MATHSVTDFQWLRTGDEAFVTMLAVIEGAQKSVRFETYIFERGEPGDRIRAALVDAAKRGVEVFALVDAWGSMELPLDYWKPLSEAGGEFRWFNRQRFLRATFRDHRKLLVVDDHVAQVGGFNISNQHLGDGINWGWRDIGVLLTGPLAEGLAETFDRMFLRAELKHRSFLRVMKTGAHRKIELPDGQIILSGPGRGLSRLKRALMTDLRNAGQVQIMAAYFLPTLRLRIFLTRLARQGVKVQLLLPGKSDVVFSQWASRRLYDRLMKAGIELYEYQPQVLHGKMIIIGDVVYVGSANLDTRSLHINYELSLRLENPSLAEAARQEFAAALQYSHRIHPKPWRKSRDLLDRIREGFAYWVLARFDLYLARRQLIDLR